MRVRSSDRQLSRSSLDNLSAKSLRVVYRQLFCPGHCKALLQVASGLAQPVDASDHILLF